MVLSSFGDYEVTDVFYDGREFVRAYVGMGVDKYVLRSSEVNQQIEHLGDISPFGRTGIKLSI